MRQTRKRSTRRAWLATIAVTGSLAGCLGGDGEDDGGGDDDSGDDGGADDTSDDSGGADGDDSGGSGDGDGSEDGTDGTASVQVAEHGDLGEILVGSDGMTLYQFDSDTQGEGASTCTGGCAGNWPPLTVEGDPTAGSDVEAELTTFEREDGSTQVAADGWPLYYWANDSEPGDATGQGVNGVWWVLRPDGEVVREDGG